MNPPAAQTIEGPSVGGKRPSRCPRHAKKSQPTGPAPERWIRLEELWSETFRLFFPLALVAGVLGVIVWPLVFWGWMERSPIQVHTRLMSLGFFGGFVYGFLGTSLPRLLKTRSFRTTETIPLLGLHTLSSVCYFMGNIRWGDGLAALTACYLIAVLLPRIGRRSEVPAPGFLMVIPGVLSLLAGLSLALLTDRFEGGYRWDLSVRLFLYHGFVLLCLLGAGGFLLPRFLGLGLRRMYGAEKEGNPIWRRSAWLALGTGFAILASYGLDIVEQTQWGATVRGILVVAYLAWEMPLERLRFSKIGVNWILSLGLLFIPLGILVAGWWPTFRVGLSHLELAAGVGLVTLGIASRVVFGHTGNREKLEVFHPWLSLASVLMILGIGARIAGDLRPDQAILLYILAGLSWVLGALIWGSCLMTKVFTADPDA